MKQRFLELNHRTPRAPEVLHAEFDQLTETITASLPPLIDQAKHASWERVSLPWFAGTYHIYEAYRCPIISDASGYHIGIIALGSSIRNRNDSILVYTISEHNRTTREFETVESRGFKLSPDGLRTIDYMRDGKQELPIYRDEHGLEDLRLFHGMMQTVEGMLPAHNNQ